ncbi:6-chlorohydroxyquinol-1,2-dioxygenase [Actinomycetospora endophytica]|uniref:6-chlorohydroxyquinol-1,2-dioxygenase n=1 Tax=Actinomycetospora endophytica TaxID=2291215 RepID=A0ABS8P8G3_9PSEU|nr:dioxygenase [Actinomycetospora endophytica]MCD2194526.1 6-chlorohydroxyquinol-1,2-dioxygenase [Actinomycetospora endophytica]
MDFSEKDSVDAVTASFADTPDPRLAEVMDSLVRHLHGFLREVRPSIAEWEQGIEFLTAIGQKCDDHRQEFILLSDVLGASMLVETMEASRQAQDATASTVLGPFHVVRSPERALGDTIDSVGTGEACLIEGVVTAPDGTPVPGARIDVWQADDHGFYDVQVPDDQPLGNGRGLFTADDDGRFWFRSIVPAHYPIPTDGPVGALLRASQRHPYRPAHVHFIVEAPGYVPVTTHVFVEGSAYLDSDAVFAVKQSLVREFAPVDDPDEAARLGLPNPFRRARFDVVLQPAAS